MPATKFNDAERYLLANWQQARLIEVSMGEIREKYAGICERVLDSVNSPLK
jgi:hypothetical protein